MNAIQYAFAQAGIINHAIINKHGFKEGWSANLSYKTYQALKAQGVME